MLLPGLHVMVIIAFARTGFNTARCLFTRGATGEFVHELLHLPVDGITSTNSSRTSAADAVVAPVAASLAVRTVTSHVTSVTTDTTDNVGGEVALLRAVIFTMTDLTTVLASLILVVTKSTVKSGELSKLVPLELVLTLRNRGSRLDNVVNQLLGLVDLFFSVCHNQAVKVFFLVASVSGVRSTLSFLDGAFATNSNLGKRFGLHFLQRVTTRSYK